MHILIFTVLGIRWKTNVFEFEGNKHFPNSVSSRRHLIIRVVPNFVKFVIFRTIYYLILSVILFWTLSTRQTHKYLLISAVTLDGLSYERIRQFLCSSLHKFRLCSINNHRQFKVEDEVSLLSFSPYWLPLTPIIQNSKAQLKSNNNKTSDFEQS